MNEPVGIKQQEKTNSNNVDVLAEQTTQIYDAGNKAIIASVINSTILVIVFWPAVKHPLLLSWFAALITVSLLRGMLSYRYIKSSDSARPSTKPSSSKKILLCATYSGSLIGVGLTVT